MNFCENCHTVFESERCPLCGNKKQRTVRDDDFCLLTEENAMRCRPMFEIFDDNGIPYSAMPYGNGIETQLGLPLKNYRVVVPFSFLQKASDIIRGIEKAKTDKLKAFLLENADNLYVNARLEKKIRKKIKLPQSEDFLEYCIKLIECAEKIDDLGRISGCLKGGHYLFCNSGNAALTVNSVTFEILSLTHSKTEQ